MPDYKLIDAEKFDADLKTLADGIRAKIGTTAPLHFPDEMAEAIRTRGAKLIPKTVEANGDYYPESDGADGYSPLTVNVADVEVENFIVGNTTELTLRTLTEIPDYGFQKDAKVTKLTALKVETIGRYAFNFSNVTSVSAPKLKRISERAFKGSQLKTLDAPLLEYIGPTAFGKDSSDSVTAAPISFADGSLPPNVHTIENDAFRDCDYLGLTSLPPALRYIGQRAFYGSSGITLNSLPERLETIGNDAFFACHLRYLVSRTRL